MKISENNFWDKLKLILSCHNRKIGSWGKPKSSLEEESNKSQQMRGNYSGAPT
jgi:hypothetical protein